MKSTYQIYRKILLLFCALCIPYLAEAYSLRQLTNKNGLSNSSISSLYQDSQGVIWIGSCDGLNMFDGANVQVYNPANSVKSLSGNLISRMLETEKNVVWIQTNYGLDRLDTGLQTCQSFVSFKDKNFMAKSDGNELFIIKDDGYLYHYQSNLQKFEKLDLPPVAFEHILVTTVDASNTLWIITSDGSTHSYQINKSGQDITLTPAKPFKHPRKLLRAFEEDHRVYFIDETYSLYEYDFTNQQSHYIENLKKEIEAHGEISSIVKMQNDYYIGFKSGGLIVLKYMSDQKIKYQIELTEIHTGIFCLMKDKFQNILWVGTDGQGLYMYYNEAYTITNTLLDTPVYKINNPVRALFYDEEQTLWVGTKGGGILRIRNYYPRGQHHSFDHISVANSALTDNLVYCFASGSMNKLWIGTENGIDYYSYRTKTIGSLPVMAGGKKVKYVHSINELNDTTLWVSTVGEGIVKIILNHSKTLPTVKSATRIELNGGRMASNYFFTAFQENDSILWFGNRGYGAYRLNVTTEEMIPYNFSDGVNSQTANDIFSIHKNNKGFWLGTSSGLLHFDPDSVNNPNNVKLFLNNTVHGILEDHQRNLWMSTNQGLVRLNPLTNTGQRYDQGNGLEVTEFSDGAFYRDKQTETLFFGGTNGFVTVNLNSYTAEDYMPKIHFKDLSIFGKNYNIHEFLSEKKGTPILQLDYRQNFFCIDFMAIDYINGNNYSYSYKLNEVSHRWIESGASGSAIFSNLSPGQYTLLVKYRNNINGKESQPLKLMIRIIPPWYLSYWAYTIYLILCALLIIGSVYLGMRKYRRKQQYMIEKQNKLNKEEVYESKLRFFTNITHEFCTPLTLISGPCEKILAYPNADSYIRKYGQIIQQNAERLNGLIMELLEFRRLETGNRALSVQRLPVSDKIRNIAEAFRELAESRHLEYLLNIEPGIQWNTDFSCLNKIANNLISNSFKYTPAGGHITVELKKEEQLLTFRVLNSGKGINEDNLNRIFDRFNILDSIEMNGKNARNGLGLAICKSMTTMLNGQINVSSIPNEVTTFTVVLPQLPPTTQDMSQEVFEPTLPENFTEAIRYERTTHVYDPSKQTIMIIDDEPSMLWFISETFADKYNVSSFSHAKDALDSLEQKQPDLIISDVMMPDIDGLTFASTIKGNKRWSHIPLILLSALHQEEDQVRGIDSGAEAYVTKPFNLRYLEKVVFRLIKRKSDLKEYYSSIRSSFMIENGNCMHKEEQEFFDKIIEIIEQNISNPDLSIELLSKEMGYSTRQFYRKLKPITDKSPTDIIREYRLAMAERLLLTTNFTIEEIIDKTGFPSRGTFYKLFSLRFGMPPRQYREHQKDSVKKDTEHSNEDRI